MTACLWSACSSDWPGGEHTISPEPTRENGSSRQYLLVGSNHEPVDILYGLAWPKNALWARSVCMCPSKASFSWGIKLPHSSWTAFSSEFTTRTTVLPVQFNLVLPAPSSLTLPLSPPLVLRRLQRMKEISKSEFWCSYFCGSPKFCFVGRNGEGWCCSSPKALKKVSLAHGALWCVWFVRNCYITCGSLLRY
jgi:hypothetical protein